MSDEQHSLEASAAPLPETLQGLSCSLIGHGNKDAIIYFTGGAEDRWTYQRLADQVERLARGLTSLHVASRDHVAICAPNRPEWIVACLAIFRIGAIVVPLDTQQTDLRHLLEDCQPRVIFASSSEAVLVRDACFESRTEIVLLDESVAGGRYWKWLPMASEIGIAPVPTDETAVLFYTSGTTGTPKGVPLSHRNVMFQIRTLADARLVGASGRVIYRCHCTTSILLSSAC